MNYRIFWPQGILGLKGGEDRSEMKSEETSTPGNMYTGTQTQTDRQTHTYIYVPTYTLIPLNGKSKDPGTN